MASRFLTTAAQGLTIQHQNLRVGPRSSHSIAAI